MVDSSRAVPAALLGGRLAPAPAGQRRRPYGKPENILIVVRVLALARCPPSSSEVSSQAEAGDGLLRLQEDGQSSPWCAACALMNCLVHLCFSSFFKSN